MSLRTRIRNYLGLDIIQEHISTIEVVIGAIDRKVGKYNDKIEVALHANARVIAKLEPTFAMDENDPRRKEMDRKLTNEVITRLMAEYVVAKKNYHDA